jgi:hypothetical protein
MKTKLETKQEFENRTGKNDGLILAASNIRKELKASFPGIKFSVKTQRFSGGDSIDIYWTDGPTVAQVDEITAKYSGGRFDGMTDMYEYNTGEARQFTSTYGSAKYVSTNRTLSTDFLRKAAVITSRETGYKAVEVTEGKWGAEINDHGQFFGNSNGNFYWSLEQVTLRRARELSADALAVAALPVPNYSTAANGCSIPM